MSNFRSMIAANNPNLKSWVSVPKDSDFTIQNLPFGIIGNHMLSYRVAVRIGDYALDLKALSALNPFSSSFLTTGSSGFSR